MRSPDGGRLGGLRAVLFDMDGILVETEELWGEAMAALATRLGGVFSTEARERTVGSSTGRPMNSTGTSVPTVSATARAMSRTERSSG